MGALGETARTLGGDIDAAEASWRDELAACQARVSELEAELAARQEPMKPIVRGIFTRTLAAFPPATSAVKTVTKPIYWSDAEPAQGQFTTAPVDLLLDEAESRGQQVRIRPMLGKDAPQWAKEIGDGPLAFSVTEGGTTQSGTIPDLWEPEYQAAAEAFLGWLAAYDSEPRVALVFASAGMTWYAEPFIRSFGNNRDVLVAAGYTDEADRALQSWQLQIMTAWTRTPVGLAYNPWQYLDDAGTFRSSIPVMAEVMDEHLALFGERTVLQNNSIEEGDIASPRPMYQAFVDRPQAAHQFQCAAASRVGDEEATIRWAHSYLGATGIEHAATLTEAKLAELDALLRG